MSDPPDRPRRHGYEKILREIESRWKRRAAERGRLMQHIVDLLWEAFGDRAVSWCGFYLPSVDGAQLVLGACRDKPACSPIGTRGACGRALLSGRTQVVADGKALGGGNIECDPSNRSEIVVPVMDLDGRTFAVLDVGSRQPAAFDDLDQRWLERIVRLLGSAPAPRSAS